MGREDLKALGSGALDNPPREGVGHRCALLHGSF